MSENNKVEIEIEGGPEIEIVDDTPEPDRGKPESRGEIEIGDDEISQYSDNVQKRIRQLRAGYHEERREKERVQREQQRRRHRVVVLTAHPVVLQQREIEIETLALDGALHRARREDDRRQSGRRAKSLLRAAVADVDAPGAHLECDRAKRRDRIDNRQGVELLENPLAQGGRHRGSIRLKDKVTGDNRLIVSLVGPRVYLPGKD